MAVKFLMLLLSLATPPSCVAAPSFFSTRHAYSSGGSTPRQQRQGRIPSAFAFDDGSFLWGLRITSAVTSYFGLVGFLDRPRGNLMENANDYLEVKESQVPGAGLGLYAKVSLPKNTILGTYPGVAIPLQQNLDKLAQYPPCEGYIWRFSDNAMVIDPTNDQGTLDPTCRGGNPGMPLSMELHKLLNIQVPTTLCRINEPPRGRDVNVVTDEDKERRQVVFSLERDVYAGEVGIGICCTCIGRTCSVGSLLTYIWLLLLLSGIFHRLRSQL